MNCRQHYNRLIETRKERVMLDELKYEKHHILTVIECNKSKKISRIFMGHK